MLGLRGAAGHKLIGDLLALAVGELDLFACDDRPRLGFMASPWGEFLSCTQFSVPARCVPDVAANRSQ